MRGQGGAAAIDHVLLTRVNVALPASTGLRWRGLDPDWLKPRVELFTRWTAPSVAASHGPPVPWLVFLDAGTPADAVRRITAALPEQGRVVPWAGPLTAAAIGGCLDELLPARAARLLTTRLDSDDALAPRMLAAVAAAAGRHEPPCYLNPHGGWQVAGSRVYRRVDRCSPFLSRLEQRRPGRAPATVYAVDHFAAAADAPVHQLPGPLWVQVIHAGNAANSVEGFRVPRRSLPAGLPLPPRDAVRPVTAAREGVRAAAVQLARGYGRWVMQLIRDARR